MKGLNKATPQSRGKDYLNLLISLLYNEQLLFDKTQNKK